MNEIETNGILYCHFFYPEIKDFICEEKSEKIKEELLSKDPNIFDHMNDKRKEGENDSYICSLIRQDLIEEFISYINKTNIPLISEIKPSIFETNSFLIENNPTLIEYASFFGSIRIFQYLMRNGVNLGQSLWLYVIHSQNAELIELLESNKVDDGGYRYEKCFIESIKCHHNDIAHYIIENLMTGSFNYSPNRETIISKIMQYHNYEFFPSNIKFGYEFFQLCNFNYQTLVNFYMNEKGKEIEKMIKEEILIN